MLFNSFTFLILFLPLVLAVSLRLKGQALLRWLALTSIVFYAFAGHVWFIIPMLITTCLDYVMAQAIEGAPSKARKKTFLALSLAGNLGMLCYFKYSALLLNTLSVAADQYAALTGQAPQGFAREVFEVILPAGISFYTFQTVSYIVDVYRGQCHAERNFGRFVCFISFFPHLVAGPLTRHDQLIPQLTRISITGIKPQWEHGLYLFAIGLSKKVLFGDRIAAFIYPIVSSPDQMTMATAWLALIGFTLQIYFDFSGYSDMAIGLGRMFGIELPQNFNSPYKARDPRDFWRRWHITLSRWLRDYLYILFGGNRCSRVRRNLNLMLTMIIGGLWHGASWTFAIWGVYHGVLLVIFHAIERPWSRLPMLLQRSVTFVLIALGWVFFKSTSWDNATHWLARLVDVSSGVGPITALEIKLAIMVVVGIVITQWLPNASSQPDLSRLHPIQKFVLGVLALGAVLMLNYSSRFLYFQF